ncbi:MAG: hypothetical protein RBS38_07645 [Bacteroidales bacterium]|jgi:NADPH:quinone reductase-like Zn-dependent oxidoreductase|nr:hypothetical protein [Bacteroidales bacterium]
MKAIIYTEYGKPDVLRVQDIKGLVEKDKIRSVIDGIFKIDKAPEARRLAIISCQRYG